MKRLPATFLALGLVLATGTAAAQTYGGYDTTTVPDRHGNSSNAIYDYARVIRVDPVIDSRYRNNNNAYGRNTYASNGNGYTVVNGQRCYESSGPYNGGYAGNGTYRSNDPYAPQQGRYGTETGRTMATVIGGIAGAVLGSKVGGGTGTYAATAIGSMVGGMAGRQIYESSQRRRYESNTVQVCDPVDDGYYGNGGYNNSGYNNGGYNNGGYNNGGYNNGGYNNGGYNNNGYANAGYSGSEDARVVGYDVTYEYAGRQFVTRTNYHPGDRIRVRVDVRPE